MKCDTRHVLFRVQLTFKKFAVVQVTELLPIN